MCVRAGRLERRAHRAFLRTVPRWATPRSTRKGSVSAPSRGVASHPRGEAADQRDAGAAAGYRLRVSSGTDRLREYRRKRDLDRTPEPGADGDAAAGQPRFTIQEHSATRWHLDLRLERDGALASFALPNGLPDDPTENRKAVRTEDHPLMYLDFEGTIPDGQYGAGTMGIWDRGTYEPISWAPRKVVVDLHGRRAHGRYALFHVGPEEKDWMIHRMDPPERGRDPMPEHIVPMLAQLGGLPGDDAAYAYEVKWDGVRAVGHFTAGRVRLESRALNDITRQYPEVRDLGRQLGTRSAVLDGEIVALGRDGKPSFELLQRRMHVSGESSVRARAQAIPVTYMIFDVVYLDGEPLMGRPYRERRAQLESLGLRGPAWSVPASFEGAGRDVLEAARQQGLEGIVAKRLTSTYQPGKRTSDWLKIKNTWRQEVVIGGWLPGKGRRQGRIGALLVGVYDHGRLRYAGRVGTGFDEATLADLGRRLEPLRRPASPFAGRQPPRDAVWVEPVLVVEVEFTEWTSQGMLRHPTYRGLRDDKPARAVVRERPIDPDDPRTPPDPGAPAPPGGRGAGAPPAPGPPPRGGGGGPPPQPVRDGRVEVDLDGRRLRLSNLDKVLWPSTGTSKGDLIDYVLRMSSVMLPHIKGRPLPLKRYPNGVEGPKFFEKRCPAHRPEWVRTEAIWSDRHNGMVDYCLVC